MFEISLAEPIFFYKAGEFTGPAGWQHKRAHLQRDFEVLLGGTGTVPLLVDGVRTDLGPGDCLVVPPESVLEGAAPTTEAVHFYWLHLFARWRELDDAASSGTVPPAVLDELERVAAGEFSPALNEVCLLPRRFRPVRGPRAVLGFRHVLDAANRFRYSQRECDFLTGALLVELTDDFLRSQSVRAGIRRTTTAPVAEWIRSHLSADLTVAAVARHFKLNPDYLNRTFRAEQGSSLRDFILELKIETAKVLLARTDLPVGQIARHAYFRDGRNFLKRFRERAGVTPSEFRSAVAATHHNNDVIDPRIPIPQAAEAYLGLREPAATDAAPGPAPDGTVGPQGLEP